MKLKVTVAEGRHRAAAVVGVLLLVVDQAAGRLPGLLVSSLVGIVYALLWFVLPAWSRGRPRGRRQQLLIPTAIRRCEAILHLGPLMRDNSWKNSVVEVSEC